MMSVFVCYCTTIEASTFWYDAFLYVYLQRSSDGQVKSNPKFVDEGYEEDEDEHNETLCGSCGGNYNADEFWICCDICERWFHGKCVKITPAKAESIKQYKCPSCSLRRGRPQTEGDGMGTCEVSVVSWLTRYCNFVTSLTEVNVMGIVSMLKGKFIRD